MLENDSQDRIALTLIRENGQEANYSWKNYDTRALWVANYLHSLGIRKGDFVAILPLNLPESFFALRGTILAGAVPVPLNVPLLLEKDQEQLKFILDDCKPKLLLFNQALWHHAAKLPIRIDDIEHALEEGEYAMRRISLNSLKDLDKNSPVIMPYTSGTTGKAKGVVLTLRAILDRVEAMGQELQITQNDRVISYLSLGHISDLVGTFFGPLIWNYRIYFMENAKHTIADREKFRKSIPIAMRHASPTIFMSVPSGWKAVRQKLEQSRMSRLLLTPVTRKLTRKLVLNKMGLAATRHFITAAASFSDSDRQFFKKKLGIDILDIYGQTETAGPLAINGRVIGDAKVIPDIETSELLVGGNCLASGYYNNYEATQKSFFSHQFGFYRTGDLGIWTKENGKLLSPKKARDEIGLKRRPRFRCVGRLDDGEKSSQGEYITAGQIHDLTEKVRELANGQVDEVIVCGAGKPYRTALLFTDSGKEPPKFKNLVEKVKNLERGLLRIGAVKCLDKSLLEYTPTLKLKRKTVIQRLQSEIDKL